MGWGLYHATWWPVAWIPQGPARQVRQRWGLRSWGQVQLVRKRRGVCCWRQERQANRGGCVCQGGPQQASSHGGHQKTRCQGWMGCDNEPLATRIIICICCARQCWAPCYKGLLGHIHHGRQWQAPCHKGPMGHDLLEGTQVPGVK